MNRNYTISMFIGIAIGCAVGYFYGRSMAERRYTTYIEDLDRNASEEIKKHREDFESELKQKEEELAESKRHIRKLEHQSGSIEIPAKPLKKEDLVLIDGQPVDNDVDESEENEEKFHSFEEFQERKMMKNIENRSDGDRVWIITESEVFEFRNRDGWDYMTLTYFELDETLVDDRNEPIPNPEYSVGLDALTSFGVGSNDAYIVYVANFELEIVYEIISRDEEYIAEVLGYRGTE